MEGPNVIIDTFHIDDLLDFSNEDIAGPIGESLLSSVDSGAIIRGLDSAAVSIGADGENVGSVGIGGTGTGFTGGSLIGSKHLLNESSDHTTADELCVPCDDIAELEWLSKFVEDSFEAPSRPMQTSTDGLSVCLDFPEHSYDSTCKDLFQRATSPVSVLEESCGSSGTAVFNTKSNNSSNLVYRETSVVPGRARSKRARTGGRVWCNSRILTTPHYSNADAAVAGAGAATDTESLSSDSNITTGGEQHSSKLFDDSSNFQQSLNLLMMTPPPKAVTTLKKPWKAGGGGKKGGQMNHQDGAASQTWRCLHCATQRTPQWRAGPMGPKTLCNACGVRYKSGRLLPEYRPAGSPGYVGHKHSNSHKKILEMRRQKETSHQQHHQKSSMLSSSCHSPSSPRFLSSPPAFLDDYDEDAGICTSQN